MSNVDILFLNNKAMDELGVASMVDVMRDVENVYILTQKGDVIAPGKCVMRWGKTVEDENDDEIIYFNAVGAGIMDIAVTARCYRNAQKEGKGIKLPFWEE